MPTLVNDRNGQHPGRHDGISEGNMTSGTETKPSQQPSPVAKAETGGIVKESLSTKQYKANVGRRFSARSPVLQPTLVSLHGQISSLRLDSMDDEEDRQSPNPEQTLFNQVLGWLQQEKEKSKRLLSKSGEPITPLGHSEADGSNGNSSEVAWPSVSSDRAVSLDKLEKILHHYATTTKDSTPSLLPRRSFRRRPSRPKGLRSGSVSDSDYFEDAIVPSVDAVLDNTKTLSYTGGAASSDEVVRESELQTRRAKDKEHWLTFKTEIVRLTHTLGLKGWRRVPMESSGDIEVTRLSGALTNAVYVVIPPRQVPPPRNPDGTPNLVPRRPPPKLLLRIYGPQVAHLINREHELQILRRLGRKNIGPRVLGTFTNGRFEEFFNAHPLTPRELRNPETSRQIAKRMRELHDGIDLLDEERTGGAFVFQNWDKWVDRCEQVISYLNQEVRENHRKSASDIWRKRGFVCGVPWSTFRRAVENYRKWLIDFMGGLQEISKQLVFAHNDTQYGNLLRLEPREESPLLLPVNEHKQLVVIDFEYASANTPGLEFANHFTEWCYNYHDPERSWACNTRAYPTIEEQYRFISAYVHHRSQVGSAFSPLTTPDIHPSSSISTPRLVPFTLEGPAMSLSTGSITSEPDRLHDEASEAEIQHLIRQTRLWRVANSAQWVAWGIVQAKIPGMDETPASTTTFPSDDNEATLPAEDPVSIPKDADINDAGDEFDYLAYAQDRALFFWADLLTMGLVREEDLPAELLAQVKMRILKY